MSVFLSDLTVFVISSGHNPCYDACLQSLNSQTVSFKIEIIKDVHPMSKAFQCMIDSCKTRYYIEIDEDMVMNANGIEILHKYAIQSAPMTAMIACKLIDVHLNFEIYGVKIYKHDILKRYPYDLSSMSCEVEQIDRMKNDQYKVALMTDVVGQHAPYWSNEGIFDRYRNLLDKFKQFRYPWTGDLPAKLWSMLKTQPTEQNMYALLGAYTSLITETVQVGEKDFRNRNAPFETMRSFMNPPVSANLYLTSKCNFNCKFCYRNSQLIEQSIDMTLKSVSDLLIRYPSIRGVCCAGYGEPFLCDSLFDIISFLKSKNKVVGLITNGSLIVENINSLLANRPDYISISLNASNAKIHSEINKSFTFDTVLQGIRLCVSSGLPTYCSYVCTKSNLQYIPEFLKLVDSLGVKTVHLLNLLPHLASDYDDKSFWQEVLTNDDRRKIDALQELPEAHLIKLYPTLINRNEIQCNCQIPWTTIGINGNESVTFCGSVYAPDRANGSLKNFENVWLNKSARELRTNLCDVNTMTDTCKMCFRNCNSYNPPAKQIVSQPKQIPKKLKVCKIIDQFGWAYYFVAKEQQLYSSHDITYKRLLDVTDIDADIVYIHAPNIDHAKINSLVSSLKQKGIKVIGGYGGESKLKYDTNPDLIVSISMRHIDCLNNMYPNKPVVFLPESIDTSFFTAAVKDDNNFIVGWAGCLRDVKRPHLLDKLKFNVVKKNDWGKQFFSDGRLLDDMKSFYHSIDVLVLTSISECMPRVVLEAMSCGLPVVSTRVGCIGMLLDKDWIVSVLPEENVISEMNHKLSLLSNSKSLRQEVGKRNRQHILKFFSWAANQKLWDRTFELVMQNRFKDIAVLSDEFIQSLPNSNELQFNNLDMQTEQTNFPELIQCELVKCEPVLQQPKLEPASNVELVKIETRLEPSKFKKPVFISYYTKNTGYENEYKKLESSLKRFSLDYEIVGIDSQGSWFNNCFYRTTFVKDMLNKHGRPVVWVDCDAIIQQDPQLLSTLSEFDFAFHPRVRSNGSTELLGGTMYFNCTVGALKLLAKWTELVNADRTKYRLDQSYLHEAVSTLHSLKVYYLPATYCQIFDLMKDAGKPVIEHFQASRKYKQHVK
jgi:MoaA/NifB/PqqE/SkfB family radical SAM enzyme/glycosyltransferase involved in cell wall biosynthesis